MKSFNPRASEAIQHVATVAIAVTAAHALGLRDSWWAAISAFTVLQVGFGASLYRGALRILGTVCGAGAGVVVGPWVTGHSIAFVTIMAVATWTGLFASLTFRRGYAWLLMLVTFVMVVCEAFADATQLLDFAWQRCANVALGCLACVLVAALADRRLLSSVRGEVRAQAQGAPVTQAQGRGAARHALEGAIAMGMLCLVLCIADLRHFAQAMVTTIAVMVVPLERIAGDPHGSVLQRMAQRFAGCLAAGALALALLPVLGSKPAWCQLALGVGVGLAAWQMRGPPALRYAAVQFGVAFIMVFVQDRGWTPNDGPALQRLSGMLAGIAALSVVMGAFHLWRRRSLRWAR